MIGWCDCNCVCLYVVHLPPNGRPPIKRFGDFLAMKLSRGALPSLDGSEASSSLSYLPVLPGKREDKPVAFYM